MLTTQQKALLKEFIDQNIYSVDTYYGYKGDVILRIRTASETLVSSVISYCQQNNIESNTLKNFNLALYEVFIIGKDKDIYSLKD